QAGHVLYRRADDQSRPAACQSSVRRLDRGDAGPLALGAVRAFGRRYRDRRRDFYALAEAARQAAIPAMTRLPGWSLRRRGPVSQNRFGTDCILAFAGMSEFGWKADCKIPPSGHP